MKKLFLLLFVLITLGLLYSNDLPVYKPLTHVLHPNILGAPNHNSTREAPAWTFITPPTELLTSYYDYMIGGYNNLPMCLVPDAAGGGYFLTFHGQRTPSGLRRIFTTYIHDDGSVEVMNELTSSMIREGYSALDVDPVSGKPIYAWHSDSDNDGSLEVNFNYDDFLQGIPGLISLPHICIDNPISITASGSTTTDNEFIWPTVAIGPSPTAGMRRAYVLARNTTGHTTACENPIIAWADFNTTMLEEGSTLIWNLIHIPQLESWNADPIVQRRPFGTLVVGNDGRIYFVGYHSAYDASTAGVLNEPDMDVFACDNYGQGTWQQYSASSILPSGNPHSQGGIPLFTDVNNQPVADDQIYWKLSNSNHLNAVIDDSGLIHFTGTWTIQMLDGMYEYDQFNTVKEAAFDTNNHTFSIREIYPIAGTSSDSLIWQPWDTNGDGFVDQYDQETGYPIVIDDWNYPYWDDTASAGAMLFDYNQCTITEPNAQGMMATVWENSWKARRFLTYNDTQYSNYLNAPEIFISISPDNGLNWSEPIKINSIETPQFNNNLPMYVYPADQIKYMGISDNHPTGKLGLLFFDDNNWGSGVLGLPIGPMDGGQVKFMTIDIEFPAPPVPLTGITGTIRRSDNHLPIPEATITAGSYSTISDMNGAYSLTLPAGNYQVTVTAFNYIIQNIEDVAVNVSQYTILDVDLVDIHIPPAEVTVSVLSDNNSIQINWQIPTPPTKKKIKSSHPERDLLGFIVWRLTTGQENNEELWALIANVGINTTVIDSTWRYLDEGSYRYAIQAQYSDHTPSPAVLSNSISRYVYGNLTGYTKDLDDHPVTNSSVTLVSDDFGSYEATTDINGLYSFSNIHYGIYLLHFHSTAYEEVEAIPVTIIAHQAIEHNIALSDSLKGPGFVTAEVSQDLSKAVITWQQSTGIDTRSFNGYTLWRFKESDVENSDNWVLISSNTQNVTYIDESWGDLPVEIYMYAVQSNYSGSIHSALSYSNSVVMPGNTNLLSIAPNPFTNLTHINFVIKHQVNVKFQIFNVRGSLVRTMEYLPSQVGNNRIVWDGKDNHGKRVSSGIYLCRMKAENKVFSSKMLLLK